MAFTTVGDVMYDAALVFGELAKNESTILTELGLGGGQYLLATVHRAENTDNPDRLENILKALEALSHSFTVVFPVHPRTRKKMQDTWFRVSNFEFRNFKLIDPVSFLDMVQLEKNALCILTDSGGVQKEAYFHGVPCVTLRDETEWVETVAAGWNQVVGTDVDRICQAVEGATTGTRILEYGNGDCSVPITQIIREKMSGHFRK